MNVRTVERSYCQKRVGDAAGLSEWQQTSANAGSEFWLRREYRLGDSLSADEEAVSERKAATGFGRAIESGFPQEIQPFGLASKIEVLANREAQAGHRLFVEPVDEERIARSRVHVAYEHHAARS